MAVTITELALGVPQAPEAEQAPVVAQPRKPKPDAAKPVTDRNEEQS